MPEQRAAPALTKCWQLARDRPLHANERSVHTRGARVLNEAWDVATGGDRGDHTALACRTNCGDGALGDRTAMGEQRAIKVHDQQLDR